MGAAARKEGISHFIPYLDKWIDHPGRYNPMFPSPGTLGL